MPHNQQGILSMLMMQRMRALLQSPVLPADEIYTGQILCDAFTIEIVVEWGLVRQYQLDEKLGNQPLERHFGQNVEQFHEYRKSLMTPNEDEEEAHQQFLQSIIDKRESALLDAQQAHQYHQLEPFSVQQSCPNCAGHGDKKCKACNGTGRKPCYRCHGRGLLSVVDALGQRSEQSCDCMHGYHRCMDCDAQGHSHCSQCKGEGVFTLTCQVDTVSQPNVSIRVQSPVQEQGLREYFQQQGIAKCMEWFDFKMWYHKNQRFQYRAESVVLEQHFHFYLKNYIVASFGEETLHIFLRPPLFDDIFANQIRYLQSPEYQQDLKSHEQMVILYHQYKEHPILNLIMQYVAQNPVEQSQKMVQNACQDFISAESARILGRELKHLFVRLSPTYHQRTWINAMVGMGILTLLIWHYQAYLWLFQSQHTFTLQAFWIWLMVMVIVCLKTLLISHREIHKLNKAIGEQYWQDIDHKKPIKYFFIINFSVFGFCLVLCGLGWLFNLHSLHQHFWNKFIFNYGIPHDVLSRLILWFTGLFS